MYIFTLILLDWHISKNHHHSPSNLSMCNSVTTFCHFAWLNAHSAYSVLWPSQDRSGDDQMTPLINLLVFWNNSSTNTSQAPKSCYYIKNVTFWEQFGCENNSAQKDFSPDWSLVASQCRKWLSQNCKRLILKKIILTVHFLRSNSQVCSWKKLHLQFKWLLRPRAIIGRILVQHNNCF